MLTEQQILDATKPVLFVVKNEDGSIRSHGSTRPDGACEAYYADDPAVAVIAIGNAKNEKDKAIIGAFQARVAAGVPYGGKLLQIRDQEDRGLVDSVFGRANAYLRNQAAPLPNVTITWPENGFPWRMADDSFLLLSPEQFIEMAQLAADYYGALFYVRSAMRDAVAAATTVEEVEAIDVNAGWPGQE